MRVRAIVEYVGTAYAGWQYQPDQATIQGAIERAIRVATGTVVRVDVAGRTDAGVHAMAQVIAFDLPDETDLYKLRGSLNALTPNDIAVVTLERAVASFDPRRDARMRTYRYTIVNARPPSPLLADRSWHVYAALDGAVLNRLGESIVGTHDFRAFRAADCESESTVRDVYSSTWSRADYLLTYEITANAFLKQMVRILVGSMVDVALGRRTEAEFRRLLEGASRGEAGRTAPARGLILLRVGY
jgi:tRNA pseudouridine38-40 synthase